MVKEPTCTLISLSLIEDKNRGRSTCSALTWSIETLPDRLRTYHQNSSWVRRSQRSRLSWLVLRTNARNGSSIKVNVWKTQRRTRSCPRRSSTGNVLMPIHFQITTWSSTPISCLIRRPYAESSAAPSALLIWTGPLTTPPSSQLQKKLKQTRRAILR